MDEYLHQALTQYEAHIDSGKPFYMDASTLMDIEAYYEKANRPYDAERCMRFANKLHPGNEDVQIVNAYRLRDRGEWNEAERIMHSIPNQENREVQLFYAEQKIAAGLPSQAERIVDERMPADSSDAQYDWLLDLGEILIDYGYAHRAAARLEQIPSSYPEYAKVCELLADAWCQCRDFEKSTQAAMRLIDLAPYDAASWTQLAEIQQKGGLYAAAVDSCDYALAIDPEATQPKTTKVFSTFAQNKYDEGIALCQEYTPQLPNDYVIRMYWGEQLYVHGVYKEAANLLSESLSLCAPENPDRSRLLNGLAYCLLHLHQNDLAEETMLATVLAGSSPYDIHVQLAGWLYDEMHQEALAIQQLGKAARYIQPQTTEADGLLIAQQLTKMRAYEGNARSVWASLFERDSQSYTPDLYAYLALGAYYLHHPKYAATFIPIAVQKDGETLLRLFADIYPCEPLANYPTLALRTSQQWSEEAL